MNPARVASDLAEIAEIDRRLALAALLPVPEIAEDEDEAADLAAWNAAFGRLLVIGDDLEILNFPSDDEVRAEVIRAGAIEAEARFRAMGFAIV
jgi:hypothetical protein